MTAFISYSGERDLRLELIHSLRDHGVIPWRDVEDLDVGARTTATIESELAECSGVILWMNEAVLGSAYVANVELPAIARAARDRRIRIVPVFDGLRPSDAADRISAFGIEIGDNNGHEVDPKATTFETAVAIAARYAAGEIHEAQRTGRPPIVRMVTYDDTAGHRDDAILNFDWRHRLVGPNLDDATRVSLSAALLSSTGALKAAYGAAEVAVAVKAHLPTALALGHAFAEPTGCTIRMERGNSAYILSRATADVSPLRETPYGNGPVDARAAAIEVAVSRETEAGVNAYVGAGNRYHERVALVPPDGPGRFALDHPDACNAWARQASELISRLAAKPAIDRLDLFLACPVELAVAIGWWANATGPLTILDWTGKAGPYAPMWRLP